jgi:hypothetical protein
MFIALIINPKSDNMNSSEKISEYINKNQDWRGELILQIRELILETMPEIEEEWKWNSPVWTQNGMVCSAGAFKKHVSLTFFKGSVLEKKTSMFNSPADSKRTRSIIWKQGDVLDRAALIQLVQLAVKTNSNG